MDVASDTNGLAQRFSRLHVSTARWLCSLNATGDIQSQSKDTITCQGRWRQL